MEKRQSVLHTDFVEQLRDGGIGYKGFGIIPKYVMLDTSLTIEAKSIYAYLCSLARNGTTAFPSRDTILSCLKINKDTYYKHFALLSKQGYITKEQQRINGDFGSNLYTLVTNQKKFKDTPAIPSHAKAYSTIRFSGLKAAGYGMIPYAVMIDHRLGIKAKGVYAYFCAHTGGGLSAFPKRDQILYHLSLSENTYYKYYKQLIQLNYMTIQQRTVNGKFNVNDYFLTDKPDVAEISQAPRLNSSDTQTSDTTINNITNAYGRWSYRPLYRLFGLRQPRIR